MGRRNTAEYSVSYDETDAYAPQTARPKPPCSGTPCRFRPPPDPDLPIMARPRRNAAEYGAEHQTDWTDQKPAGERLHDLTQECRNEYVALGDACHLARQISNGSERLGQLKRNSAEWQAEQRNIAEHTEQFERRYQELGLTDREGKTPDPTAHWLYDDHDAATYRYANAKFYEGLFERTGLDLVGNDEMPAYGLPEEKFPDAERYPQLHRLLADAARDNRSLEFEWRKADRLNRISEQLAHPARRTQPLRN